MAKKQPGTMQGIQVKRAVQSKQPRFERIKKTGKTVPGLDFMSVLRWYHSEVEEEPDYLPNNRKRDEWLSNVWRNEPHLAGVIGSVVSIDTNRGWTLEGGRNQVYRYTTILHDWTAAPGLVGYRPGCAAASQSFYYTDMGGIVELGRDGQSGPLRKLYHVDPTRCVLTNDGDTPLYYEPAVGSSTERMAGFWAPGDFMRMSSLPDIHETYNGLGYCAVSRVIELTKLMVAVYEHDKEKLGSKAPKGLLILKNVSETQWDNALQVRAARENENQLNYFDAVAVLATMGGMEPDAKLIALSSLPENFDIQAWTSMMMYGYALCFGYDPSEFYPVQFGALGRGTEMEVQHEKATGKGGLNYIFTAQEQWQRADILPAAIHFEYDQRDEVAEVERAVVAKAWVDVYSRLRETGLAVDGEGVISREEERMLLADESILPKEWTEVPEEIQATDEELPEEALPVDLESYSPTVEIVLQSRQKRILRDRLMSQNHILRAVELFPREDIVRYHWPKMYTKIVWRQADTLLNRITFPVATINRGRLTGPAITKKDVDLALGEAEIINTDLAAMLNAETS